MNSALELSLRARIEGGQSAREAINDMLASNLIKSPKQAWRTLEKWTDQGIWEYGVNMDLGWFVLLNSKNEEP